LGGEEELGFILENGLSGIAAGDAVKNSGLMIYHSLDNRMR
jgi:hypothetical protein